MKIESTSNQDGTVTLRLFDGGKLCNILKNKHPNTAKVIEARWQKKYASRVSTGAEQND